MNTIGQKLVQEEEMLLDIDSLPDLDENSDANNCLDQKLQEKEVEKIIGKKTHMLNNNPLTKARAHFRDSIVERTGDVVRIKFTISQAEMQQVTSLTFGLLSSEVNEGVYEFQIIKSADGAEELYYYDEFAGEMVDGEPRIYKYYFNMAIVRSMVKQDILFEYKKDKFTVHPVFYAKLIVHNSAVAEALSKKGFPIVDQKTFEDMKKEDEKAKEIVRKKMIKK